ncbi:MAG: hypothetical protein ABJH45_21460 [Paracoccaceae bacterium]
MKIFKTKKPEEVFTPRSDEVNSVMYINRPEHEYSLRTAVRTGYNVVIFGDSGCGKSWLYKKIFRDDNIYFSVIDFRDCKSEDDVDLQILELISSFEAWEETEKIEKKSAEFKPSRIGVGDETETKYKKVENSPYLKLLSYIRKTAGKRTSFLVFENLEYALDRADVVDRIRSMLIGLDDVRAGSYKVRICLVGVPSDVKEILSDGNRHQTISNRVYEIPEVGILDRKSVDLLATRGLEQELDFSFESKTLCLGKIAFVTYRVPQFLHDVCLHVALRAEDNLNTINPDVVDVAVNDWIKSKAVQSVEFIRSQVMYDKTARQAKSKILFSVSRLERSFFSSDDVSEFLNKNFPKTMKHGKIQTLRHLRSLCDGNEKILKCDNERRLFRVSTPYLRSSMRISLALDALDEHIKLIE